MDNFILFLGSLIDFSAFSRMFVELTPRNVTKTDDEKVRFSVTLRFKCVMKYVPTTTDITYKMTFESLTWEEYEKVIKSERIIQRTMEGFDTVLRSHRFTSDERINLLNTDQQEALLKEVHRETGQSAQLLSAEINSIIDKLLFP